MQCSTYLSKVVNYNLFNIIYKHIPIQLDLYVHIYVFGKLFFVQREKY